MQPNANHNTTKLIQPKVQIATKKRSYKFKDKQTDNLVSAQLERRRNGKVKDLIDESSSTLVSDALNRKRGEHEASKPLKLVSIQVNDYMNPASNPIDKTLGWCRIAGSDQKIIRTPIGFDLDIREDGWWRLIKKEPEPEQKQHLGLLTCIFIVLIVFFSIFAYYYEPTEINNDDFKKMLYRIRH